MALFEGKTSSERNKIIAAAVLGVVALIFLYLAFGRSPGGTTTATTKSSPTPNPAGLTININRPVATLPTASEQDFAYQTTPVLYQPGNAFAPDAGRNIFAFYEPPAPCKSNCPPSPIPSPTPVKPPTPLPPPQIFVASVNPQTVYAGARGFRLELNGDKFTPDSHIYFNQSELPTTFINAQKIVADIPAKYISTEGSPQIIVQTPDGKLYSNQMMMTVQAPPKPTMLYIGMIGRKRYNNDTAYFTENEKSAPFGARLNDVLSGRFRLVDISPAEVIFEDTNLGFRHHVLISRGIAIGSMPPGRGLEPNDGGFNPAYIPPQTNIPGIPNNIQQYQPNITEEQKRKLQEQQQKADVDDEGDG